MFARTLVAGLLAVVAPQVFAAPVTYTLDPGHTTILFTWNHFGYSNPSAVFAKNDGTLVYDAADPTKASVEVTIPVASVDTHVPALDKHLQSGDFFEADKFPNMTFKSTKVEKAGEGKLKVTGDLTVHGVTKPVTLDVSVNKVGDHPMWKAPVAGFDATTTIKRSDFGVKTYVPAVSDDIKIHISTEGIEAKAYAAAMAKNNEKKADEKK